MRFLLDTNVISEPQKPLPAASVERFIRTTPETDLYISVITIGELRRGLSLMAAGPERPHLAGWLADTLPERFAGRLLPVTLATAAHWGDIMAHSQRAGLNLSIMDGFLAATAKEHGLTVATRNVRHFAGLDVPVFNPWEGG